MSLTIAIASQSKHRTSEVQKNILYMLVDDKKHYYAVSFSSGRSHHNTQLKTKLVKLKRWLQTKQVPAYYTECAI